MNTFRARLMAGLLETLAYSLFVSGYFWLVWHFLREWVLNVFETDRTLFALAAVTLISGQGVLLEILTGALLRLFRTK